MNILITGGTGFVGHHLVAHLKSKGHKLIIITRSPEQHEPDNHTTYVSYDVKVDALPVIDAVINLAGESIFGYWTKKKKEAIRLSRVRSTQGLIDLVATLEHKPSVWINGSAVGFYGMSDEVIFTEETTKPADDFLAQVVLEWESTAAQAEQMGIRTVYTRFGVILGDGGALPMMSLPVKAFAGGKIGSGTQWMSWVHIEDVVQLIAFCLHNPDISGPINVTSPNPQQNASFMKTLADVLNRPFWLPTPTFMMATALGQMSQLMTKGQYVLPQKAQYSGYSFAYTDVKHALEDLLNTTIKK
ncbi:TIGR01777 family oxidoreductase [Lentibacillus saliphilus]|uniref:TIGR01777 family oxidoreductase n=1 Tax=Lentibacillus saliphilus TaxID=2737028 RepID=UPI001C2F599B|nr:TIGR01777 family oxidoreductase [Lentibacillus saliphilus]